MTIIKTESIERTPSFGNLYKKGDSVPPHFITTAYMILLKKKSHDHKSIATTPRIKNSKNFKILFL